MQANLLDRNGLTTILQVGYPHRYDYETFIANFCNRICRRLYCTGSVAHSGRIACLIRRDRGITFTRCVSCRFAQSEAHSQASRGGNSSESSRGILACIFAEGEARSHKSRGCSSGESRGISITCEIQHRGFVQTENFWGSSQSRRSESSPRERREPCDSNEVACTGRRPRSGLGQPRDACLPQGRLAFLRHD